MGRFQQGIEMKKVILIILQILCFFGTLLFFKLVNYVPIPDVAFCYLTAIFIAYWVILRWVFHINIDKLDGNDTAQIRYVYFPLFCAELAVFIYYRQPILSLSNEILQINGF